MPPCFSIASWFEVVVVEINVVDAEVFSVVDDTVVVDNETNDDWGDDVAPVCDVVDVVVLDTDDVAVDSTVDDADDVDDDNVVSFVVAKVIGDDDEIAVVVGDDVSSPVVITTV